MLWSKGLGKKGFTGCLRHHAKLLYMASLLSITAIVGFQSPPNACRPRSWSERSMFRHVPGSSPCRGTPHACFSISRRLKWSDPVFSGLFSEGVEHQLVGYIFSCFLPHFPLFFSSSGLREKMEKHFLLSLLLSSSDWGFIFYTHEEGEGKRFHFSRAKLGLKGYEWKWKWNLALEASETKAKISALLRTLQSQRQWQSSFDYPQLSGHEPGGFPASCKIL